MTRQTLISSLQRRFSTLHPRRQGFALAVCGPPGIGKSHTASRVLEGLVSVVVRLRASAPGAELARAFRALPRLPEWVLKLLEQLESGHPLGSADLSRALAASLRAAPLMVLLLEDLHECDPDRLQAWTLLAVAVREGRGSALLGTSRGALPPEFEAHWLEPLSESELQSVLLGETKAPLPAEVLTPLTRRSGGNPLFALEFLRGLRRQGELWLDGEEWRVRGAGSFAALEAKLPDGIGALIEQILQGLGPDALRTLELSTLLSGEEVGDAEFEQHLFRELSGFGATRLALARMELEHLGILRGGVWGHLLFLEVARARVGAGVRRHDAARAVSLLEDRDPLRAARLVAPAGLSGADAVRVYARAETVSPTPRSKALWATLALPHQPEEVRAAAALDLLERLGGADLEGERQILDLALEVAPEHLALRGHRARMLARSGQIQEARARLGTLVRRDPPWQLEWLRLLAASGEHAAALAVWDASPELREQIGPEGASSVVGLLAYRGRFAEGEALFGRMVSWAVKASDAARLYNALGVLHHTAGALEAALAAYTQAFALCETTPSSSTARLALGNTASLLNLQGRFQEAEEAFARTAQATLEAGDLMGYAGFQAVRGANRTDQGQFEGAEALFLEARSILESGGISFDRIECEILTARMYALWGQPLHAPLALRLAHQALEHARVQGIGMLVLKALDALAFCESRVGDPRRALEWVEQERLELGLAPGELSETGKVQRALALERLGQRAEAEALLMGVLEGREDDPGLGIVALELDRVRGDRESAQGRAERFAARGFGLGVALHQRYFPQQGANPNARWRLSVLGPLMLERAGTAVPLRGEKRKLLLALLLEAQLSGQREVRFETLMDALYPDAPEVEARAALKQLVFQVRASLGPDLIGTGVQGYALLGCDSDVGRFLGTLDSRLWRGPYLAGLREGDLMYGGVQARLSERLLEAGRSALEADPREAARVGRILLEMDPFDSNALELGLQANRAQGHYSAVGRLYEAAKVRWLELDESLPPTWTEFLSARADGGIERSTGVGQLH